MFTNFFAHHSFLNLWSSFLDHFPSFWKNILCIGLFKLSLVFVMYKRKWVDQLCLTLCDPMVCSPPDSFVRGILQARILEWVVIPFSRGSSWSRDQIRVSCIAGGFLTIWATKEAWPFRFSQLGFTNNRPENCLLWNLLLQWKVLAYAVLVFIK